MDEFKKSFGRTLQHWRKLRGMTQEEFAERARVSWSHLNAIEGGRKAPSFDAIKNLSDALGISPKELFDVSGAPVPGARKPLTTLVKILETQPRAVAEGILEIVQRILKLPRSPARK